MPPAHWRSLLLLLLAWSGCWPSLDTSSCTRATPSAWDGNRTDPSSSTRWALPTSPSRWWRCWRTSEGLTRAGLQPTYDLPRRRGDDPSGSFPPLRGRRPLGRDAGRVANLSRQTSENFPYTYSGEQRVYCFDVQTRSQIRCAVCWMPLSNSARVLNVNRLPPRSTRRSWSPPI